MDDPFRRPTFGSAVFYKDPVAALDWPEKAYGFERTMVITDASGKLVHSEMRFGDGYIMVGYEYADFVASPASAGSKNTQSIHIQFKDGIDAHSTRARAAGASRCTRTWRPTFSHIVAIAAVSPPFLKRPSNFRTNIPNKMAGHQPLASASSG